MMTSLALVLLSTMSVTQGATACQDLASLVLPRTTITSADFVPAGPYVTQGTGRQQQTGPMLPDHCRVAAVLEPSADSHIEMEIWLPAQGWNGKFLAVGNGGWAGSIPISGVATGLSEGYATAANDTGHKDSNASFAVGHPEKLVDFAYRSVHEMAVGSKAVIEAFYDEGPTLSYFQGCSTGGRQGMMEAQRYPADFDAIIVGAPVYNMNHLAASQTHNFIEIVGDPSRQIPREKIEMIADRVMAMCDADDGAVDGLLSDPEMCRFDPAALACTGDSTNSCLTPGQVRSLEGAYTPTFTEDGELVYPGHAYGFELGWRMPESGGTPQTLHTDTFRYLGHQDPDWDWRSFDLDMDLALARANAGHIEATDPDLSEFKARGGKMIFYHGWNDPGPSPLNTIQYYNRVLDAMGSNQDDWMRVYMMPGMGHCRGGVGPDQANFLAAMERWVESGIAPDRIRASKVTDGRVEMSRPLCPYPQVATWVGVGSTNDAQNFVCEIR